MKRLIAIVGPTGIGKSRLALHLCKIYNGEIISADSRQVYQYLNIGTAKPTPEEVILVPHHLVDIIDPGYIFSLTQFQEMANQAIEDIQSRDQIPFLVGGSGLYIKAILEGFQIPKVSPDITYRDSIEKIADEEGTSGLYQLLSEIDPEAAGKIDPNNLRRIIRALEVSNKTEAKYSNLGKKGKPGFHSLVIGLTTDRARLYHIVDERIDMMFERGLVEEVEKLLKMGYDFTLPAMSGIGYRQVGQYLRGELTLDAARQKMKTETHRFIRHQYAWFRMKDERIHWFDTKNDYYQEVEILISDFLDSTKDT